MTLTIISTKLPLKTNLHTRRKMVDELFSSNRKPKVEMISNLKEKRDKTVIEILMQVEEWYYKMQSIILKDSSYDEKEVNCDFEERPNGFRNFPDDTQSMDAVTLECQHQGLLFF